MSNFLKKNCIFTWHRGGAVQGTSPADVGRPFSTDALAISDPN